MSDYRRLISYIYEYEGKEKGKNVGFVKLEARNGQCRLNLSVKKVYMGSSAIGVFLLSKAGFPGKHFYPQRSRRVPGCGGCEKCGGKRRGTGYILRADHP